MAVAAARSDGHSGARSAPSQSQRPPARRTAQSEARHFHCFAGCVYVIALRDMLLCFAFEKIGDGRGEGVGFHDAEGERERARKGKSRRSRWRRTERGREKKLLPQRWAVLKTRRSLFDWSLEHIHVIASLLTRFCYQLSLPAMPLIANVPAVPPLPAGALPDRTVDAPGCVAEEPKDADDQARRQDKCEIFDGPTERDA